MLKEFLRSKNAAVIILILGLGFSQAKATLTCTELLIQAERTRQLNDEFTTIFQGKSLAELRSPDLLAGLINNLKSSEYRKALENWLIADFEAKSLTIEQSENLVIPNVIVGAGPHTLVLLAQHSQEQRNQALVVEKAGIASSFLGKYFRLNSTQFGDLNYLPGALVQLKDFMAMTEAPLANDFGFLVLLNYRLLGIRVLLNYEVKVVEAMDPDEVTPKIAKLLGSKQFPKVVIEVHHKDAQRNRRPLVNNHHGVMEIFTGRLGIATGMEVRNYRYLEGQISDTSMALLKKAERGENLQETRGVTNGDNFLRQVKSLIDGQRNPTLESAKRFVIAGAKHEAFTVAEGILALMKAGKISAESKIIIQGLKSHHSSDFAFETTPQKGSDAFKAMIRNRYMSNGIPEAIDRGTIIIDSESSSHVRAFEVIEPSVRKYDRWGSHRPGPVVRIYTNEDYARRTTMGYTETDLLILATGFLRENAGLPFQAKRGFLEDDNYRFSNEYIMSLRMNNPVGSGFFWYENNRQVKYLVAYTFGVASNLPISSERLQGPIGNPDALFVTLPATAELGKMLSDH